MEVEGHETDIFDDLPPSATLMAILTLEPQLRFPLWLHNVISSF